MERAEVNQVLDRLSDRVDDLRDRLAEGLSGQSSQARRALEHTAGVIEQLGEELGARMDELTREHAERFEALEHQLDEDSGRGWFGRLFWVGTGMGLGAALMYYLDPETGPRRRDDLDDQVSTFVGELSDTMAPPEPPSVDDDGGRPADAARVDA